MSSLTQDSLSGDVGNLDVLTPVEKKEKRQKAFQELKDSIVYPDPVVIKSKLENGECVTTVRPGSSDVWNLFEEIRYATSQELTHMVRCQSCGMLLKFHAQLTGTSGLRKHPCFRALSDADMPTSIARMAAGEPTRGRTIVTSAALRGKKRRRVVLAGSEEMEIDEDDDEEYEGLVADDSGNGISITGPSGSSQVVLVKPMPKSRKRDKFLRGPKLDPELRRRYTEIIESDTRKYTGHLMCRTCRVIVFNHPDAIAEHKCRRRDLENPKIQSEDGLLIFRTKPQHRITPVWSTFEEIYDPTGNNLLHYVRCKRCRLIFRYSDPKGIAKKLRWHLNKCNAEGVLRLRSGGRGGGGGGQFTLGGGHDEDQLCGGEGSYGSNVTVNVRRDFVDKCINFVARELVSVKTLSSPSFRQIAASLMALGAKYGSRVSLALPDTRTLNARVSNTYDSLKDTIRTNLQLTLERNCGAALVCDTQAEKCVMSVSYINSTWKLVDNVLNITLQEQDVAGFMARTLADFGINDSLKLDKFTFVSHGGYFEGVSLCLPSIGNILDEIVSGSVFTDVTILELVEKCKLICSQLGIEVAQQQTEWLTQFTWCQTVVGNEDNFELKSSEDFDMPLLSLLVRFIQPFAEASTEMRETSQRPTLNLVLLWYYKLIKHCEQMETEMDAANPLAGHIRKTLLDGMVEKYQLTNIHRMAVFLWPNFKQMKMLSVTEKDEVHMEMRMLLDAKAAHIAEASAAARRGTTHDGVGGGGEGEGEVHLAITDGQNTAENVTGKLNSQTVVDSSATAGGLLVEFNSDGTAASQTIVTTSTTSAGSAGDGSTPTTGTTVTTVVAVPERRRTTNIFDEFEDTPSSVLNADEVTRYVNKQLPSCSADGLLNWWRDHEEEFPRMAHLARWILAIPATVTALERFNSNIATAQTTDEKMLFLHCNL